MSKLGS